jgi:hypothetical protein
MDLKLVLRLFARNAQGGGSDMASKSSFQIQNVFNSRIADSLVNMSESKYMMSVDCLPLPYREAIYFLHLQGGGRKYKRWSIASMVEVHHARFLLRPFALEIFLADQSNALLNFPTSQVQTSSPHPPSRNKHPTPPHSKPFHSTSPHAKPPHSTLHQSISVPHEQYMRSILNLYKEIVGSLLSEILLSISDLSDI